MGEQATGGPSFRARLTVALLARACAVVAACAAAVVLVPGAWADVSGVSVNVNGGLSGTAGDFTATWNWTFTPSLGKDLGGGDTITLTYPAAITPATGPVILGVGFIGFGCGFPPATGVAVAQSLTITLAAGCSLAGTTAGTVSVTGVTPALGVYPSAGFTVGTSQESTAVGAAGGAVTISAAPTTPTGVTFSGQSLKASVLTRWTAGFTASGSGALAAGSTVTATFPSGFTLPASPTVTLGGSFGGVCTGQAATGDNTAHTVTVTLSGSCVLANGAAGTIAIPGIVNAG